LCRFGCSLGEVLRRRADLGLSSLAVFVLRGVKRLEVIVGGDKWRLSLACVATRLVDPCIGLPRLYETGPEGTGWWLGRRHIGGAEQGDFQLEVGRRAH
jgi:hypothetical protein